MENGFEQQKPWPVGLNVIGYGGDYNPEQWPRETRLEDIALMQEAGVNIVSLGIFSWASIEPRPGEYDFVWLDEMMDLLHEAGIRVALATATASPPPWLTQLHPEILPQDENGTIYSPVSRQCYSITHPLWLEKTKQLTEKIALRYKDHPALALWHVDNEIGCHVPRDYSDTSAVAFRQWLQEKYSDIASLNEAWGTSFWSQKYSSFAEILPPRRTTTGKNPGQKLDFYRYSSDAQLRYYRGLVQVLRRVTPEIPTTTNLMATSLQDGADYFSWTDDMDIVANDHYLISDDEYRHVDLAFSADLTRGIARGNPWLLMEHATSAVNWQPRNRAKGPGEMMRNSLSHVARGSDTVMFFQWRQSQTGSERFHSAMLPHAGTDSLQWRRTVELGSAVGKLSAVVGSKVEACIALLFDYNAWWATNIDSLPSEHVKYMEEVLRTYRALWQNGVVVDVVSPSADLSKYDLIVVPTLFLIKQDNIENITQAARRGANLVITYFSGIVDECSRVILGGYPGAFRDLAGIRVDEFLPLTQSETLELDGGQTGSLWSERIYLTEAQALSRYLDGELAGIPAITRKDTAESTVWYVGTTLDDDSYRAFMREVLVESNCEPSDPALQNVEQVTRVAEDGTRFTFFINHQDIEVTVNTSGFELLRQQECQGELTIPALSVAVVQIKE